MAEAAPAVRPWEDVALDIIGRVGAVTSAELEQELSRVGRNISGAALVGWLRQMARDSVLKRRQPPGGAPKYYLAGDINPLSDQGSDDKGEDVEKGEKAPTKRTEPETRENFASDDKALRLAVNAARRVVESHRFGHQLVPAIRKSTDALGGALEIRRRAELAKDLVETLAQLDPSIDAALQALLYGNLALSRIAELVEDDHG